MAAMDVWLGAETGLLKGVSVSRKQAVNFSSSSRLSREQEVRALCWSGAEEKDVLVGSADGLVRTFSTEKGAFTCTRRCGEPREGCFSGLLALGPALATCTDSGTVRVWKEDSDDPVTEVRAGEHVNRMRQSSVNPQKVATGGKQNPLKIWDLENPDKPVFSAKNLRDTWLDLRQPHWVKDMAFLHQSERVVTCTGYHQVHVYDPSSPQRRPVLEAEFGEYPLTALSLPVDGHTVAVANTHGQMALLDLRKGLVRGVLKGSTGSVRGLQCHASLPIVASCGLDRFLRIHSLQDRKLQHKVYLKSRLNCVLLSSRDLNAETGPVQVKEEEEEQDDVWDAMESVHETEESVHGTEESVHGTEESVHLTEESVHLTEESVHGTEESVHGTEESVHGTEESVHLTEESVHGAEESVHKTEESVHGTEESVHETEESVHEKPKRKAAVDQKQTHKKTKKRKKGQD